MITPSFGLTATERVLPRMALDFTTASLDARVTFTRSGNTATVTNSSGFVVPINADLPRFDFNPTTLACKGLLIEEARTNLLTYSQLFSDVIWVKTNSSVTDNALTAPSGTLIAGKLIENLTAGQHWIRQDRTVTANTAHTVSLYAKAGERDKIRFGVLNSTLSSGAFARFNLTTGVIDGQVTAGTATNVTFSMTNAGNGWYRCAVTAVVDAASVLITPFIGILDASGNPDYTGNGTSGFYLWGAQLEAGAFPTSYIPTVASQVTRNADVATMTGTNFSSWYNASEGSIYVKVFSQVDSISGKFADAYSMDDSTTTNKIECIASASYGANGWGNFVVKTGNVTIVQIVGGTKGIFNNFCGGYKVNNFASGANGVSLGTNNIGSVPTGINRIFLGSQSNGNYLNGIISKFSYYPQRLIDNELLTVSKG